VELRRVIADAEAIRDQLVRQPLGEQLDDLPLALGQLAAALGLAKRLARHEARRELGVQHGEPAAHGRQRGVDPGPDLIAQDDAARARREGRGDVRRVADHCDDRHRQVTELAHPAERLAGVHARIP